MSNIKVAVTADVADLTAKLAVAKAETAGFTKELNTLARQAAAAGGNVSSELKNNLLQAAQAATTAKQQTATLTAELKAQTGTTSGLSQAMQQAAQSIGFGSIGLAGAAVGAVVAVRRLFEALKSGIRDTEEFAISNAKVSAALGINTEEAAGLTGALKAAGSSTDEYIGMTIKLERQVKNNEKALVSYGLKTRDANGQLVDGQQLMENAIATMQTYRAGTDQNEFAIAAFGRGASEVRNIMLLNKAVMEEHIKDLREFGVDVSPQATRSALDLRVALAQQEAKWEDMKIAIGQRVLPMMLEFMKTASGPLTTILKAVEKVLLGVAAAFAFVGASAHSAADIAVGAWNVAGDIITGKWDKIGHDAKSTIKNVKSEWTDLAAEVDKLFANPTGKPDVGGGLFGSGDRDFVAYDKGAAARAAKAAEEARKLADELTKIYEAAQLAHVQSEEQTNAYLLQIGARTNEQFIAAAEQLENKRYAIELKGIREQEATDANKKSALAKDLAQEAVLWEAHEDRITHLHEQATVKRIEQQKKETQEIIADKQQEYSTETKQIEDLHDMNFITDRERHDMERALTITIQQEILKRKDAEIAYLKSINADWKQALRERTELERKFATDVANIDRTLVRAQEQQFSQAFGIIGSSFNTAVTGMAFHGESFKESMLTMASSIGEGFVNMALTMGEKWIESQLEMLIFSKTSAAEKITADAGVAFAETMAAFSGIPIPGFAETMAAERSALVMTQLALVGAEGGMERVPYDEMPIRAHRDESVLPARISIPLMSFVGSLPASGASRGGFGGDVNIHAPLNISALDGKSVASMFSQSGPRRGLERTLKRAVRGGVAAGLIR